MATASAKGNPLIRKIPLGFDCIEFKRSFELAIRAQWLLIQQQLGGFPRRLWLPVGSGTLTSVFKKVVGKETQITCVNMKVLEPQDSRIRALAEDPSLTLFSAPECFHEKAEILPSIPSNTHYDAKIWQFLEKYAVEGDLWWNVAR